ncbi:MAG: hypothetical protein WHT63_07930 [Tepidiforma sp.]|jgi:hypothetical protein|uniref:hypothetical protein n=1 Tax=Tepidiforma sp. TaxID=2682230 RepID=UPI00262DA1A0|nr:hypothetical protein [Tepidiforma sp.]MCX7617249.1 hypothetical protein [Tepidiforma sp.]
MERTNSPCQHEWRYLVEVRTRAIRIRECARCGRRSVIPVELAPLPGQASRLRESA